MTIKFLGEVKGENVPTIAKAITRAASNCPPFTIALDGCGCFPGHIPSSAPVRTVWAGIREMSGSLQRCAEAIDAALTGLGFAREHRSFSPHITLGRVRDDHSGGRLRLAVGDAPCAIVTQAAGHITLMSSVLSAKGPTYTTILKATLGGSGHESQSN